MKGYLYEIARVARKAADVELVSFGGQAPIEHGLGPVPQMIKNPEPNLYANVDQQNLVRGKLKPLVLTDSGLKICYDLHQLALVQIMQILKPAATLMSPHFMER